MCPTSPTFLSQRFNRIQNSSSIVCELANSEKGAVYMLNLHTAQAPPNRVDCSRNPLRMRVCGNVAFHIKPKYSPAIKRGDRRRELTSFSPALSNQQRKERKWMRRMRRAHAPISIPSLRFLLPFFPLRCGLLPSCPRSVFLFLASTRRSTGT